MTNSYRTFGLLILFALLLSIYTMSSAGRFHIVDEVSLFAVTESLATRGEMDTNIIAWTQWVNSPGEVLGAFGENGEVYSKKGPAPAFLAVPWYLGARLLSLIGAGLGILQTTLLWNGVVTAATAALLFGTAVRLGYRSRAGMLLGLLFGLATIAWPYANHFFGEPLSALSLLLTFYGILAWRQSGRAAWMVVAGVGAGIMLATVTAHALLIAVLGLYAVAAWYLQRGSPESENDVQTTSPSAPRPSPLRSLLAFTLPLLFAGGLLMLYNNARFGDPFDTGYHFDAGEGFTNPFFNGFWGLVFSPYRGVFWHTPLFIVSLIGFAPFLRRHQLEAIVVAVLSLVLIGLYSLWWMWWGGYAWGPRFLVPMTPFWVLLLAPIAQKYVNVVTRQPWRSWARGLGWSGILFVLLALLSFIVQIGAVTQNYVNYETLLRSIYPTDWADPLRYGPPAQAIGDFRHSPVIGQFRLMLDNFVVNTDLAWLWADGNVQLLVLAVGTLVIGSLTISLVFWWRADNRGENVVPSVPMRILIGLMPIVLIATWTGETSRNPGYGDSGRGYRGVLEQICAEARPGKDVVVTVAPFAYQIPMNWMPGLCRTMLPVHGYAADSMAQLETQQVMERLLVEHTRIWFVTGGLPANAPENQVERWLADAAYKADDRWVDDYRLVRYATPVRLDGASAKQFSIPLTTSDDAVVTIMTGATPTSIEAGAVLPIHIEYEVVTPQTSDLRWFIQLLAPDGYPLALLDSAPVDGYAPFTQLAQNEVLTETFALQLPPNAPAGIYQLIAGLYDPAAEGAPRLTTPDGSDFVEIGKVEVRGNE